MATGLPPSWEVRHSNSKNLPYYFNTANKESRWEPPTGTDAALLKAYMATHHSSSALPPPPAASSSTTNRSSSSKQATDSSSGEKIRAAHLLVKHEGSRRPSSWKEENITRTKGEALEMLRGYERRIKEGGEALGELAKSESDCSSARKKGDLYVWFSFSSRQCLSCLALLYGLFVCFPCLSVCLYECMY